MAMHRVRKSTIHKRQVGVIPGGPDTAADEETTTTEQVLSTSTPVTTSTAVAASTTPATLSAAVTTTAGTSSSAIISSVVSSSSSTSVISSSSTARTTSVAVRSTTAATSTTPLTTTTRAPISRTSSAIPTSSPSMTMAATDKTDDGAPVGTIIGVVAGGLVGVVVLAAVAGWFFRRTFKKKEDFNKSAFMRNSVAIPDVDYSHEKVPMGSKNALNLARANSGMNSSHNGRGPRPPTMIEQHVNRTGANMPSYEPGQVVGGQDPYYGGGYQYGAYGTYGQQDYNYQQQDPYYQHAAYVPPNEYQQSELVRRPSGPGQPYLQRQPSNGAALTHPDMAHAYAPDAEYPAGRHESITPFQQQQYNEINRQLANPIETPGQVVLTDSHGYNTRVDSTPPSLPPMVPSRDSDTLGRSLSTSYSSLNPNKPPPAAQRDVDHARSGTPTDPNPQQNYYQPGATGSGLKPQTTDKKRESVFDADDAYGGI